MATSGDIDFTLTARSVIQRAYEVLGVYGASDTVEADDAELARVLLNAMLKSWQSDGCNLWREEEDTLTVPVSTASVTMDPRVIDVLEARVEMSSTYERPLARWEWGEYVAVPNKAAPGVPAAFVLRKERAQTVFRVWPVPTAETTIHFTAARVIEDVTALDDELDLPQEWLECVIYNLAAKLAIPHARVGTPEAQAAKQEGAALYAQMRDMDRPASVFFQPG